MNPKTIRYAFYDFTVTEDGSIVWDSELSPEQLRVKPGDKFEVVFVPGNTNIVFKKLEN